MFQTDPDGARKFFDENVVADFGRGRNYAKIIRKWGKRHEETHDVKSACTGRVSALKDDTVLLCVKEFLEGYMVKSAKGKMQQRYYGSIEDAISVGRAPTIMSVIRDSGMVKPRQLWRRMTNLLPMLRKKKRVLDIKATLTAATKKERYRVSGQLSRWSLKRLRTVVWIDAKKLYVKVNGDNKKVYSEEREVFEDETVPQGKLSSGKVLHYYAGINALVGVVHIAWVSGTTGINGTRGRRTFRTKVSRTFLKRHATR